MVTEIPKCYITASKLRKFIETEDMVLKKSKATDFDHRVMWKVEVKRREGNCGKREEKVGEMTWN